MFEEGKLPKNGGSGDVILPFRVQQCVLTRPRGEDRDDGIFPGTALAGYGNDEMNVTCTSPILWMCSIARRYSEFASLAHHSVHSLFSYMDLIVDGPVVWRQMLLHKENQISKIPATVELFGPREEFQIFSFLDKHDRKRSPIVPEL